LNPGLLRLGMNLWSPFRGAGIRIKRIAPDYREIEVELSLKWHTRNYIGTHFGGSLYAMTDPFYMLMLIHVLGRDYVVSHQAGAIEYLIPEKGRVHARFFLDDATIEDIKAQTAGGQKYLPQMAVDVKNEAGELVARVSHTLYIRKKKINQS
jgi:acyl-coenzyme A thioesterase PaaI-like protein